MHLNKWMGIDTNFVVRVTPYLAHLPIVIVNDIFIWKVSKRVIGHDAARICFLAQFFNRYQTMHMIRTLTNSIEQMFTVVAFYFYIDQKDKFTTNTVILTALISIAFMIRNTSPIGWVPLLAIKVFREGSWWPFVKSGIFVALPILFFCVWVDTKMYQSDKWVFTGYNFLEMNILHGLSKTFGEDGFFWYIKDQMVWELHLIYPFALLSLIATHPRAQLAQGRTAYIWFYTLFYLLFFSKVGHKESRFMLPIWPFLMITTAEFFKNRFVENN